MSQEPTETATASLHVMIIGGGIGGLCLAQGLKKSGISVAVFERDPSAQFRRQGYRISLKEDGSQALRHCLPEPLFNLCVATSIKQATRLAFLDHQLNPAFVKPMPPSEHDDARFGVHRLTLREILLAGMEDVVRFGKTFARFDQSDDGRVRAYFTDGTSATGDLLVGADGTDSVVRGLIAPDAVIDDLHCAVYGKTPITSDTMEWLPDILVDSFSQIHGPAGISMGVTTCRKRESFAHAAARLAPALHLSEVPDYLSWTLSLDEAYRDADAPTLHQLAYGMLAQWHPALRRVIAEADVPATFPVTMRSARPVERWRVPSVTLLGDAVHAMSPGRGEGANTALRDAQLLCQTLVDVAEQGVPLAQAKAQYETAMLHYGFEAVAASLARPFSRPHGPG